jgi:hypothetical protein
MKRHFYLHPNLNENFSTSLNSTLGDSAYSNGVVSLVVVSELTAPIDVAPIQILIYVRASDNFELAGPKNPLGVGTASITNSFLVPQSDGTLSVGFRNQQPDDKIYAVHFGEVVKSIKNLMYRTNHLYTMGNSTTADYRTTISRPRLPPYYGYDPFGISTAEIRLAQLIKILTGLEQHHIIGLPVLMRFNVDHITIDSYLGRLQELLGPLVFHI